MKAELIACGTELLLGHKIDTNSAYISKELSHIGIEVYYHTTVGDNKDRLSFSIKKALTRSDIVIITGGLGPTIDDITTEVLSYVTNRDLILNKIVLRCIRKFFARRSIKFPKDAKKQAYIPKGAKWIKNKVGTAPGLIIKDKDKYLIALPGPPRELKPMLKNTILPYLKKLQKNRWIIKSKSIRLTGLPEAKVNEKIKDLLVLSGDTTLGIYMHLGEVELRITTKAKNNREADININKIERKLRNRLNRYIYGTDDETLQEVVGRVLRKHKLSLAIAESCTGGYLSNLITNVPGSSKYFILGIIAYSNYQKKVLLNISEKVLKRYGAVSKTVARLMAQNVRKIANTDIGIGITGIAGPTGQTRTKPVGLVYIALSTKNKDKDIVKGFRFIGQREEIKILASKEALNILKTKIVDLKVL